MADVRRATAADGWLRVKFQASTGGRWTCVACRCRWTRQRSTVIHEAEVILKRAIPVLIVAFLSVVALARVFGILSEHDRLEAASRQSVALTASAAEAAFAGDGKLFQSGDRASVEASGNLSA